MSTPSDDTAASAPMSRREAREAAARAANSTEATPATPASPVPATPTPAESPEPAAHDAPSINEANADEWAPEASRSGAARAAAEAKPDDTLTSMHDLFSSDHAAVKPQKKRRGGCLIAIIILLAVVGGITAGGIWAWNTYGDKIQEFLGVAPPSDFESGLEGEPVNIKINDEDTGEEVSRTLYESGVTMTSSTFYDYLIKSGKNPVFFPGVYQLRTNLPAAEALEMLENPGNKLENTLLIIEGDTAAVAYENLALSLDVPVEDIVAAASDPSVYGVQGDSLEGWLFPATYEFDAGTTPQEAIQILVDRMVEVLDDAGVPEADRQRILTVASIIQREARYEDDFFKVSRVIENRLDPGNDQTFGKLEMDSTAQYGVGQLHAGDVWSSEDALTDDNPWNTYIHPGLPKGPISLPGELAIKAAMEPADGPWLYFVTVNLETGETVFTTNLADHEAATEKLREWCEANPDAGCA